jgi:amino-acid N-acetyltransferase
MNTAAVSIRKAGPQDAAVIRAMVREARINPFSLDWRRFLLAVDGDGAIIGSIQVKQHGDGTREMASLVVIPARRKEGLARLLIETVQASQSRPLYLTCRSSLQPIYRKFGFRTLEFNEMPPYYRRLYRVARFLGVFVKIDNGLTVMAWE